MNQPCPCGRQSGGDRVSYQHCCGPLHQRQAIAETAEALMRSRFSAFVRGDVDYLLATHDPLSPDPEARSRLVASLRNNRWLHLQMVDVRAGGPTDTTGEVEFIATFEENGRPGRLRERSTFRRRLDAWVYVDGQPAVEWIDTRSLGRNDPCWCGSGKKLKKCHG